MAEQTPDLRRRAGEQSRLFLHKRASPNATRNIMHTLKNKTALVTGASRGIGRATATALAEARAHVLVHYGRSAQEAESLVAAIREKGGRADAISADLAAPDSA